MKKTLEPDILEVQVVETITPEIDVVRTRYSAPFPVAPREFVAIRYRVANEKDNEFYILSFSINHKSVKSDSSVVRGVLHLNVVVIKPVPGADNKAELIRILDVEPKGNVPNFIVTMTKNNAASFAVLVRKVLLDGYAPAH